MFQDYTSFSNRSVLETAGLRLECRGVDREERHALAREWIGKVGLNPDKDAEKYPHQLGGMKQRVAIARTLILKPRIILGWTSPSGRSTLRPANTCRTCWSGSGASWRPRCSS
ncbi:MAG: ATP-binding cassette domain-containing protein [Kiritimatiellia bacterium]